MSTRESRARAERAFQLRAIGRSWYPNRLMA
jgi:hypothetical protein